MFFGIAGIIIFRLIFMRFLWFRLGPDQPSTTQPANPAQRSQASQPANQPTQKSRILYPFVWNGRKNLRYNTPRIYLVWELVRAGLAASESLKVELEQPIHGNILGHSATVGVFVAIEFSLCDVFLKLLVTRSRTWQRKWHGRGTECTKTRRHGPNRTEREPGQPQTDAKKVYWKPFPGA